MLSFNSPFIVGMRVVLQVSEAFRYEASFGKLTSPPALRGRAAPGAGCPLVLALRIRMTIRAGFMRRNNAAEAFRSPSGQEENGRFRGQKTQNFVCPA